MQPLTEEEEFEFRRRYELERAQNAIAAQSAPPTGPTQRQKDITSLPRRVLRGVVDPVEGMAQLAPRALEFATSIGGIAPNALSHEYGREAANADKEITASNKEYEQARQATGHDGIDWPRVAGNIVSPANLALMSRIPMAASVGGRALGGALSGAAGSALTPVSVEDGEDFSGKKLGQMAVGAITGGVATPVLGKIGDAVIQRLAPARQLDMGSIFEAAKKVAKETGITWSDIAPGEQEALVKSVVEAVSKYRGQSPEIASRMADFDALGIPYTRGQVTRDPLQFASEKNLMQLPGTGDPLRERFMAQGTGLQNAMRGMAGSAMEEQAAGDFIAKSLANIDASKQKAVSQAYNAARESAGKDAELPLQGLAQDYAQTLNDFGDKIPSAVRSNMEAFGISPSSDKMVAQKLYTVDEAEKLLKVINANRTNDPATNLALDRLRSAVKNTVTQDGGVDDVYGEARKLAADRFKLQEAVPALDASAAGSVNPDTFVRNYITSRSASTPQVQKLADLLREESPDAFQEARLQIANHLRRKAFGENLAGDKGISPERMAAALRDIGTDKLKAFFNGDEVDQLQRIARVGSYMESVPYASKPNTSGNWGAITQMAQKIPGIPQVAALANVLRHQVGNQLAVGKALSAPGAELSPAEAALLAKALVAGGFTSGAVFSNEMK